MSQQEVSAQISTSGKSHVPHCICGGSGNANAETLAGDAAFGTLLYASLLG